MHLTLASLMLLLALAWPCAAHAAEEPDEAVAENQDDANEDAVEGPTGDDEADSGAEDPIVAEAAEAGTAPRQSEDDTFVPTVQISEDLSVSFPADI